MEVRHNPRSIDEREGMVELKPIGRDGNPRVGDWEVHWMLRLVLGSSEGIGCPTSAIQYCRTRSSLVQPSCLCDLLWRSQRIDLAE
jgi:hypothetical protein